MVKKGSLRITVIVVPSEGKSRKQDVEVAASGASLREVLKAAGIDPAKKDFSVNGEPATLDTHVSKEDFVEATDDDPTVSV